MTNELTHKVSDGLPDEECLDINQFAAELGIGPQRQAQLIRIALKQGLIQDLVKVGKRRKKP